MIIQSLFMVVLAVSSCSTVIGPVGPQAVAEHLAFLHEGQTTRQEVIEHFGNPLNEYEQGGIISYFLVENSEGQFEVIPGSLIGKPPFYNLILSFGADDILSRLSLLRLE